MKLTYSKPHINYQEQVELLKSRNLLVSNDAYATSKLSHINYYRLSAYARHYYCDETDIFRDGTRFEDILRLYYFDKKLRNIIFYAIEKIEVYLRTKYAYLVGSKFGAFGYIDMTHVHSPATQSSILASIQTEVKRSKEIFVSHFFENYEGKYLPVWSMVEVTSFNTLSRLFSNLKEKEQNEIADSLGLKAIVFKQWLHTITYVRNICAHHSRLWNKMLAVRPIKPRRNQTFTKLNNKKIFFVLTMIVYLLEQIDGDEYDFKAEVKNLV
ncbi:MAG: Abi family protein, partial [Sulfurimonas sp.]|nr:Abi family protein [Sulfurimonas sp.]